VTVYCKGCGGIAASGRVEELRSAECWCDYGSCPRCGSPFCNEEWREDFCATCNGDASDGPVAQEGAR